MRTRLVLLLTLALLGTTAATAQQIQPLVLVADFQVKPGKDEQFMNLVKQYYAPVFDKLMAEGAVLAWGVEVPVLHQPGAATHSAWWSMPEMGGLDKVFAAFEELQKKMKAEDEKAAAEARRRGRPSPKTTMEQFFETVDLSTHKDLLLRELVFGGGSAPPPADARPYSWITVVRAQPGKGEEYRRLWEEYNQPVYDGLLAEGAIFGYALGIEEARSTDAFTHYTAVRLPNLAAREKVRAAFNADRQRRTAAERSIITSSFQSVLDTSASRTLVLRSVIFHAAPPPK